METCPYCGAEFIPYEHVDHSTLSIDITEEITLSYKVQCPHCRGELTYVEEYELNGEYLIATKN